MAGSSSPPPSGVPNWSAERAALADPRKYRWQGVGQTLRRGRVPRPSRRRRRFVLGLLGLLGLFAIFVYALLFAPIKTPLIVVAGDYAMPAPVSDWTAEDLDGLKQLDGKTFRVVDTSAAWQDKKSGLAELDRSLRDAARRRGNDGSVVFYIALHGVVDGDGRPCLLLPGNSPFHSDEWLPVEALLNRITTELPANVNKIVLFDSCRVSVDWRLGIVQNTFVERVGRLVRSRPVDGVHVITAAGPGERSWASADLNGSSFGRAVAAALAGQADRATAPENVGNKNGRVSLAELHRYVAARCNAWSMRNRGVAQSPQLFSSGDASLSDFRIAWALGRSELQRQRDAEATAGRAADAVPLDEIARLWRQLDALRATAPYQTHPFAWHDVQNRLLRLEQLAVAGRAHRAAAEQLLADLRQRIEGAAARATQTAGQATVAARCSIFQPDAFESIPADRLHTIALAETFGTIDAAVAGALREQAKQAATTGAVFTPTTVDDRDRRAASMADDRLPAMLSRYRVVERWKSGATAGDAVGLQARAEALAVVGDPRAHYWLRPALDAADATRRSGLDSVLLGPTGNDAPWTETTRALDRIGPKREALRPTIERALAVRDRGWAEAVYLAEWSARSPGATALADVDDKQATTEPNAASRLTQLLVRLRELGAAVDDRSRPAVDELPGFVRESQAIAAELDAVTQTYRDVVERLLSLGEPSGTTVREMQSAAGVPLLPADDRLKLLQKATAMASQLHTTPATGDDAKPTTPTTAAAPTTVVASNSSRPHPLELVLDIASTDVAAKTLAATVSIAAMPKDAKPNEEKPADDVPAEEEKPVEQTVDTLSDVERLQAAARRSFAELPMLRPATNTGTTASARDGFAQVERRARAAASLTAAAPTVDPVAQLLRFDLQQLLLWHARRTLDDFWGVAAIDEPSPADEPQPFFDLATSDDLIVAGELLPPGPEVRRELDELELLLNRRRAAARRGATVSTETGVPDDNPEKLSVDVAIAPGLASPSNSAAATGWMPTGTGVVFARNVETILPLSTAAWPVPADADAAAIAARVRLTGDVPTNYGSSFEAVAMFRGNEFTSPFARPGLGGVIIDFEPQRPTTAQVTLFGDRPQQPSVMFVLDCSSSMSAELPVELIDANRLPRLDVAKGALNSLLEQLAVRGDTRVGVKFFGHRVGWARGETNRMLTQNDYAGPIPDDLNPSADVETVLPLGRFDTVEAGLVSVRLKSVKPWGQSPLYLSLIESLRDFDSDRDHTDKSIVCITDGGNYQFSPAGDAGAPAQQTVADVLAAWETKRVPIYILGVGMGSGDDAAAQREFTTLADQTGGRYFVVDNGRDLLRTLRERLGFGSYQVEAAAFAATDGASFKLNAAKQIGGLTGTPLPYVVRFQESSAEVALEGGEALELFAGRDGRITARPYDVELPVLDAMVLDGDDRELTVRAHRPRIGGTSVRFPVSLQDPDAVYTPRPDEVWIEISPVLGGKTDAVPHYVFYDRRFEPGKTVPVVPCTATAWPAASKQARVRVWCKYGRTEPFQVIPAAEVRAKRADYLSGVAVRGLEGIRLRVQLPEKTEADGRAEVKIVEEHDASSAGLNRMKVMFETDASMPPDRIVRRYDAARRLVIHSFYFSGDAAVRMLESSTPRVALTSRTAAVDGAFQIEAGRALSVDVGGSGDLLPLDAATGVR